MKLFRIIVLSLLLGGTFTATAQIMSNEDLATQSKEFLRKQERLKEFIEEGIVKFKVRDAGADEETRVLTRGNKLEYTEIPTVITDSLREQYNVPREKIKYAFSLNDGIYEVHLERRNQIVYFNRWDGKMFNVGLIFENARELRKLGINKS